MAVAESRRGLEVLVLLAPFLLLPLLSLGEPDVMQATRAVKAGEASESLSPHRAACKARMTSQEKAMWFSNKSHL
jgi:hypothetical protein